MAKSAEYTDGKYEDWLLEYFNDGSLPDGVDVDATWALKYHLSEDRGNIVNWFSFKEGARVLEVGAGPGAVTEALAQQPIHVTALELTEKRAAINRLRNKNNDNVTVITGNLEDYKPKQTFDYIVCIGVLEYAGSFISADQPYETFLSRLHSLLGADGVLLLAIENRLGMKYLSGAMEDHTGKLYDGINRYPEALRVQTFGRKELQELALASGFRDTSFYYPFPDYKLPRMIFSDKFFPGDGNCEFPLSTLPTSTPDKQRLEMFSESLAVWSVEQNGFYRELSNSFILVAGKQKLQLESQPVFTVASSHRKPEFAISTRILAYEKGVLSVEKHGKDAGEHIARLSETAKQLKKSVTSMQVVQPTATNDHSIRFPYIKGRGLERLLIEEIITDNQKQVLHILDAYLKHLKQMSTTTKPDASERAQFMLAFGVEYPEALGKNYIRPGNVDINLDNIIVDEKGSWHLFDCEWVFDFAIPSNFIVGRMLWYFFGFRYGDMLRWHAKRLDLISVGPVMVVPRYIYNKYLAYFQLIPHAMRLEEQFQQYATKSHKPYQKEWFEQSVGTAHRAVGAYDLLAIQKESEIEQLQGHLRNTEAQLHAVTQELQTIKNSRGYRALEQARRVKRAVKSKRS